MSVTYDDWEGTTPHYSSLFFASWVSFLFLWRSWLLIETSYGMHTEFTRRVSSLDLVIAHVGMTAFFVPMRFLHNAPPDLYWGVMVGGLVAYGAGFYVGMALMKLSSSPFMQLVAMLMCGVYVLVYYLLGKLGNLIVESGCPPVFWMTLNFMAIQLIVLKERTRISHSDPLDYNYTHAQKAKLRAFEGSGAGGGGGGG
ncbi:hypothetical protein TrRE_jg177, partial [Triparma retinervis]